MTDSEARFTTQEKGGLRACVYSTNDSIKVQFENSGTCAGSWMTEQTARELIVLLASVVNAEPKAKQTLDISKSYDIPPICGDLPTLKRHEAYMQQQTLEPGELKAQRGE